MAIENITVGTLAIARVGRNAIDVEVIALEDGGAYRVRNRNGKEFTARRLEPIPENCRERDNFQEVQTSKEAEPAQQIIIPPTASDEPEKMEENETPNPAPESDNAEAPEKHLSLMEAAVRVLQSQPDGAVFNTRELVAMATEQGLWTRPVRKRRSRRCTAQSSARLQPKSNRALSRPSRRANSGGRDYCPSAT